PAQADLAPVRSAAAGLRLAADLAGSAYGASPSGCEATGGDASQPGLYPYRGVAFRPLLAGLWEHSPALGYPGAPIAANARRRLARGWYKSPVASGPPRGFPSALAGLAASATGRPSQVVGCACAALRGTLASAAPAPEA